MRFYELKFNGNVLVKRALLATDFLSRFRGLMLRKEIPADEAIVFPKCNSIHTCFMLFPIDVIFVGPTGIVMEVIESLSPWRLLFPRRGVKHTIETAAGVCKQLKIQKGMQLTYEGLWP